MAEIRWTPQAADDLETIADFISVDSPHYAKIFVIDVLYATQRLENFPRSGRIVPESNDPIIREIILGNHRIVYRVKPEIVEILTVYRGSRLFDPSTLE